MKEITKEFIKNKIITVNPNGFTKESADFPIVCHSRLALSTADMRFAVAYYLENTVFHKYGFAPDVILAMSTNALVWASMLCRNSSHFNELPIGLLTTEISKKQKNPIIQADGISLCHKNVLLIEDVLTSAQEIATTIGRLKKGNVEVLGLVSFFSYDFPKTMSLLKKKNTELISVCEFTGLTEAENLNLSQRQVAYLKEWHSLM